MSEIGLLVDTLKSSLREQGITYRDVAAAIHVSEPTIKRMFSRRSFSLERLEDVCAVLGLSLLDLMARARLRSEVDVYCLTLDQERRLVADMKLYYVFWLLVGRNEMRHIARRFRLSRAQVDRYLLELDSMGILELREANRYTMKVPRNVVWNEDGPIERAIVAKALPRFLAGRFRRDDEYFRFTIARLSAASLAVFRARLEDLANSLYRQSIALDASLSDSTSTGLVVAIGPLEFSLEDVVNEPGSGVLTRRRRGDRPRWPLRSRRRWGRGRSGPPAHRLGPAPLRPVRWATCRPP